MGCVHLKPQKTSVVASVMSNMTAEIKDLIFNSTGKFSKQVQIKQSNVNSLDCNIVIGCNISPYLKRDLYVSKLKGRR